MASQKCLGKQQALALPVRRENKMKRMKKDKTKQNKTEECVGVSDSRGQGSVCCSDLHLNTQLLSLLNTQSWLPVYIS